VTRESAARGYRDSLSQHSIRSVVSRRVPGEAKLLTGSEVKALVLRDFSRFDPQYVAHQQRWGARLDSLTQRPTALQAAGNEMECSNEIYLEAKWLYRYTAYWDRLESRLDDLAKSLDQPDQLFATRQSPETGLWGPCYRESFFKVEATALALIQLAAMDEAPTFAVHPPPPFDARDTALVRFRALLVSDIANTGVDNRGELGNISTVLSLAYFKDYIQDFLNNRVAGLPRNQGGPGAKTEEYRREFSKYVVEWQDPISGYWGPWYLSEGRLYNAADLSFTFHVISYKLVRSITGRKSSERLSRSRTILTRLAGSMRATSQTITTTMWPRSSGMAGHICPQIRKRTATSAIDDMLHWTLTSSLQLDGSFKTVPTFFSSKGADFCFGVSFLQTIGFWDPARRFWTKQDFPDAGAKCERIKARLVAMALKSHESQSALTNLKDSC
jgi:hypothetical protein